LRIIIDGFIIVYKHREGRLKQEVENLTQQNDWLNKELQEKLQELVTSRKEKVGRHSTIIHWQHRVNCSAKLSEINEIISALCTVTL